MLHQRFLILYFALLFGYASNAQTKELELDPVTITSSLSAVATSKTGRNIIVIMGDEFSKLPVHSIDELLRYVPGVEIQARGPMGSQSDIVLRGGTFQQVLVIIDGVRINDPLTGHFNSYIPVVPSEIERIEILKGASSAIYGSDAVGGVINIITKAFSSGKKPAKTVQAQLTAGEYNLWNGHVGGFFKNDKTSISAGVLTNHSDGQLQRGTRGYFDLNTASLAVNHHLNNEWQVGFRSSLDNRAFSAQNYYTTFASDTANEKVKTVWNQIQVGYAQNNNKISLSVGHKNTNDHYVFNKASAPNDNKANLLQALAVYEHKFSEKTMLISGGQFLNRTITSNDRGNHNVNQLAGFAVIQQAFSDLMVSPALRFDWDERGGSEWVPQVNLSYRLENFQLRGSAGKTIRHADFTERYNNYNKKTVASGRIGNPDLSAERSFSYEIGADWFASDNLKFSSTFFQRDHHDLIDYVPTAYANMPRKTNLVPTGVYALAKNIANVTTQGFETDVLFSNTISGNKQIQANAGLVWLYSESSEQTPSFYISSHARFMTNFSARYTTSRFSLGLNGLYKTRQAQTASAIKAFVSKDYFLLNIKAEGFVILERLSLFAQVDNVLDRSYSDLLGTPMPGRWFSTGLKLSLSKQ